MNNCLSKSLDKWHLEGGHTLILRASQHPWGREGSRWNLPHVMHLDSHGNLTNYVPPQELKHPVQALFGFNGIVKDHDNALTPPMPLRGIVIGSWLLALGTTAWAIRTLWKRRFLLHRGQV